MSYPLPKDPREAYFLNQVREDNKRIASKCHYCKKQSTGINAIEYRIVFVCKDHFEAGDDVILDTSQPGVIHYTYPNGKKPGLMDPNIGGWFGKKDK